MTNESKLNIWRVRSSKLLGKFGKTTCEFIELGEYRKLEQQLAAEKQKSARLLEALSKVKVKEVFATEKNTKAVRLGAEMCGYLKHYEISPCDWRKVKRAISEAKGETK